LAVELMLGRGGTRRTARLLAVRQIQHEEGMINHWETVLPLHIPHGHQAPSLQLETQWLVLSCASACFLAHLGSFFLHAHLSSCWSLGSPL
jgi:hypothetical protein